MNIRFSPMRRIARSALLSVLMCSLAAFAATWPEITQEQKAANSPLLEPDVPAEILFQHVEVDDSDAPDRASVTIFRRFKVYSPDKAEVIGRISAVEQSVQSGARRDVKRLEARIVYANGRIAEYGEQDVRQRTLQGKASTGSLLSRLLKREESTKEEQFLALGALEAGAIVDVVIETVDRNVNIAVRSIPLQNTHFPVRRVVFDYKGPGSSYNYVVSALNTNNGNAKFVDNPRKRVAHIEAGPLHRMEKEPFGPPTLDSGLTALMCLMSREIKYFPRHRDLSTIVDPDKDGRWAAVASQAFERLMDRSTPATKRVKALAAQLVDGKKDPQARLRAIHNHVVTMHQAYLRTPPDKDLFRSVDNLSKSLDDVLDYVEKRHVFDVTSEDYLYLAIALYREAGFEVRQLMLPDSSRLFFREAIVSPLLVPGSCASIKVGEQWIQSRPHDRLPMPLGFLPHNFCGEKGIVAKSGQQELVDVPALPAKATLEQNIGLLVLDSEGTLSGDCSRRLTGQLAWEARSRLRGKNAEDAKAHFLKELRGDLGEAEITINDIKGLNDPEKPINVLYSLRQQAYAIVMKDKIILRPSVFRLKGQTPFTSSTRRNPVIFPFAWQENDKVQITLPAGFVPQLEGVPAVKNSPVMVHKHQAAYDAAKGILLAQRDFGLRLSYVPADKYGDIKQSFDNIAADDGYELVLIKKGSSQ